MAAGIQIYALFEPIGKSERIGTVAVLVVSSAQIILTRPRSHSAVDAATQPEAGQTLDENGKSPVKELSEGS
jgi:hypothetical protein